MATRHKSISAGREAKTAGRTTKQL